MSTNHETTRYVIFQFPVTSYVFDQISSSAPYFRTPSAYVPPSMWENVPHIHTKQQNYSSVYLCLHVSGCQSGRKI